MSAPDVRHEGDEVLYAFTEDGIGLTFSQIRPPTDSGQIRAFLDVYSIRPDNPGPIWWTQVNLVTQADRDRLMKKLSKVARGGAEAWERDIDTVFQDCARRSTATPDARDLSEDENEIELEHLLSPVVLQNQVNMFLADQGTTKSYLLLYLAVCIASGRVSIFGPPRVSGPVILFDWESDWTAQRRRLGWVCRGLHMPVPSGIHYLNMSDRGRIMDRARDMRQQIARVGAVAVIIDSLSFGAGGDLNATEISAPTMTAVGGLGNDVTKLITAHPPKSSRRPNGGEHVEVSALGSGLWEFRPRAIWHMTAPPRHARGTNFIVTMRDRKQSESEDQGEVYYRVRFDADQRACTFERSGVMEQLALARAAKDEGSGQDKMLALLDRQPENTAQLAKLLHTSPATVRNWAKKLKEKGLVEKLNTDDGDSAVWHRVVGGDVGNDPDPLPWN